jgi:cytochrome oxidase Cu insertion factor (SCO1/SenC/PrrC family)
VKKIWASFAGTALLSACLLAAENETLRKAPELSFSIPSKGSQLLSQYRGKVVALEFIFTTCPHCQAASKVMTKFQQEYGPRGLQVLDVAVNPNADLLVENFVKDYQVGFPVGWTPQEQMVTFMGFSSARFVVPQLVLIDRKGVIHYQTPAGEDENWDKLMKEDTIRQHIEELLSLGNSSASRTSANGRVAIAKRGS